MIKHHVSAACLLQVFDAGLQQQQVLGVLLSQISRLSPTQHQLWNYCCQYGQQQLSSNSKHQGNDFVIFQAAGEAVQQLQQWLAGAGVAAAASSSSGSSNQSLQGVDVLLLLLKLLQKEPRQLLQQILQQQQQQVSWTHPVECLCRLVNVLLQGIMYSHALELDQ